METAFQMGSHLYLSIGNKCITNNQTGHPQVSPCQPHNSYFLKRNTFEINDNAQIIFKNGF